MKKLILLTLVSISTFINLQAQEKLNISLKTSSVKWVGEKVTGQHEGFILLKSASLETKDGALTGGEFVIDMNSIKCTDIESPQYSAKLENHLKDNDFFNVAEFPEARFVITKVIYDGTSYIIEGDMTIRELTSAISFPAEFHNEDGKFIADASVIVDRTKHDVKYGSGAFFDNLGDKMIYDEFTLKVHLESVK